MPKQQEMQSGDPLDDEKSFEALTQRLKKCRNVEVVGLPEAIYGARPSIDHPCWYCHFRVKPFQVNGGEVQQRDLTVYKKSTDDYVDRLQEEYFSSKLPIKFRGRILEEDIAGHRYGMFTRVDGFASDGDKWLADNLQVQEGPPRTIENTKFGIFTLVEEIGWYETDVKWGRGSIRLTLELEESFSVERFLETAESVWADRKQLRDSAMDLAVAKLLKLKNRSWLDDGEKPWTTERFRRKLKLRGINIQPRRRFAFDFDDGDLFLGHSIIVEGSVKHGPSKAGIF